MSGMLDLICTRCGADMRRELILALVETCGASVSGSRTHCYNPDTDEMEEHDFVSYEEYRKLQEDR